MQKTVDKGSACCLTTTFRSCEHELERSRRKMTNKKFKLAAMSLATAVAVSAVGPSASAVTYQLEKGDVTVGQDGTGAYSYQNQTDGKTDNVYVDQDTQNNGQIIITQAEGTKTDNTVTVEEDVTNEKGKRDVDIILDGVNVDTSDTSTSTDTPTEVPADTKEDKTIIKVGEGADVDLTVRESNLTTGGNGIDIGVNLKDGDDNKETNVDLTLDNTKINLTENATAGINARDNSDVDITLKGDNTIDGSEAIDKVTEGGGHDISKDNVNVEGIRVGGGGAGDGSGASEGAKTHLTISGGVEKTETAEADTEETESPAGGSLTISKTTGGLVMADGSDVEITDGADVTIEDTKTSSSTQAGRAVTQHGDLTLSGGSSLTIDGGKDNKAPHTGIGIASWDDITVEDGSTLDISGAATGIYGHQGASLTTEDSTLNITNSDAGIRYEGSGTAKDGSKLEAAGDITFKDSDVTIEGKSLGIETGNNSNTTVTFDHTTAAVSAELTKEENVGRYAIYCEDSGENGSLIVKNGSKLKLQANYGIVAGYRNVLISGNSTVDSTTRDMAIQLRNSKGTKLHITDGSVYNMTDGSHDNYNLLAYYAYHDILVDKGGVLSMDLHNSYSGISLGMRCALTVDDGTVLVKGDYNHSGIYIDGPYSKISIKNNAHVEAPTIVGNTYYPGQKLVVTGGTLTYDYKADNTLWPVNEQGDKLTNFLLTKDDAHANFDALSYKGQTYTYLSDLNKETGKQYLSVWVPAAALNYMLDVDGSHDPEIIGKALEELKQAGYNFDTAYQTAENGDQVVILRDMVVNGKSLNFTKTTDAEGNTKLIWGNYEKQAEGAPSAYDMVYGTEYEYEGKTYTIVWGYESQNNPNTTAAAGVLDAFGPDSNVKVTGDTIDGTDSAQYTVTIYGALREVTDPVIPTNPAPETPKDPDPTPPAPETPEDSAPTPPAPETPEGSDPTPPAPTTPTTQAVQNARPTTPTVEQAVAKTTPAPESGKLIQTGTTNWMADVLVRAGGVLLAAGYLLERKRKGMFHKAQH
jgi:predicted lipoprotein with Yx(FWY)xxD motif